MLAGLLSLALISPAVTTQSALLDRQTHNLDCNSIVLPTFSDFNILSVQSTKVHNYSLPTTPPATPPIANLNFCNLTVRITHADDIVISWIWLPLDNWNGRFITLGGGGLVAGTESSNAESVSRGFAAASTDAGLSLNGTIGPDSALWVLQRPGVLNQELVTNFAYRSMHDVTVLGKAAVKAFYGEEAKFSYYHGCSTGGRQGYQAAQSFPEDFDGIVANAPAVYSSELSPGLFWPSVVMGNIVAPPSCVFDTYLSAIVSTCDGDDGVVDNIISNVDGCVFAPDSLVGTSIPCSDTNSTVTITFEHAEVVSRILEGAQSSNGTQSWYGLSPGASFDFLAGTRTTGNITVPVPFSAAERYIRYFVLRDPDYSTATMTFSDFDRAFQMSVDMFTNIMGTNSTDISSFQAAGGKLLTWHGTADQAIDWKNSLRFRKALEQQTGGSANADTFHRLFLAPGAGHCSGGAGPVPVDPLAAMIAWVEHDTAPELLRARTTQNRTRIERDLCLYPKAQTYVAGSDPNGPEGFICV